MLSAYIKYMLSARRYSTSLSSRLLQTHILLLQSSVKEGSVQLLTLLLFLTVHLLFTVLLTVLFTVLFPPTLQHSCSFIHFSYFQMNYQTSNENFNQQSLTRNGQRKYYCFGSVPVFVAAGQNKSTDTDQESQGSFSSFFMYKTKLPTLFFFHLSLWAIKILLSSSFLSCT